MPAQSMVQGKVVLIPRVQAAATSWGICDEQSGSEKGISPNTWGSQNSIIIHVSSGGWTMGLFRATEPQRNYLALPCSQQISYHGLYMHISVCSQTRHYMELNDRLHTPAGLFFGKDFLVLIAYEAGRTPYWV